MELLSRLPDAVEVRLIGAQAGPVRNSQGAEVLAQLGRAQASAPDIVIIPGGRGTRTLAVDEQFLGWLRTWAANGHLITSVCTGSTLLAAAGLLAGHRATSKKRAFEWAPFYGTDVEWVRAARWVHDQNRWTSSGVAAGMDMTAALIGHLFGPERAEQATHEIELELHTDPNRDPWGSPAARSER